MSEHLGDFEVRAEQPFEDMLSKAGFTGALGETIELKAIRGSAECKLSPRANMVIRFAVFKLAIFLTALIADRRQAGLYFLCLAAVLLEYLYVRLKAGRKMISAKWWTIITPEGQMLDFVEVNKSESDKERLTVKAFWLLHLLFSLAYAIVSIVYLCSTGFAWIMLVLIATASNLHVFLYFNSMQSSAEQTTKTTDSPIGQFHGKEVNETKGNILDDSQA